MFRQFLYLTHQYWFIKCCGSQFLKMNRSLICQHHHLHRHCSTNNKNSLWIVYKSHYNQHMLFHVTAPWRFHRSVTTNALTPRNSSFYDWLTYLSPPLHNVLNKCLHQNLVWQRILSLNDAFAISFVLLLSYATRRSRAADLHFDFGQSVFELPLLLVEFDAHRCVFGFDRVEALAQPFDFRL